MFRKLRAHAAPVPRTRRHTFITPAPTKPGREQAMPFTLAYIDPGTGSFLLQVLAGGFLGALVALRMYWQRLKGWVGGLFGRATKKPTDAPPAEREPGVGK